MGRCSWSYRRLFVLLVIFTSKIVWKTHQHTILTRCATSGIWLMLPFAVSHRPTRSSISSYNNAGLIWRFFWNSRRNRQNCRRRQPHSRLMSSLRGTPANVHMHLIFQETSHWPIFLSPIVWIYLHSYVCSRLQKTHRFCTTLSFGRSRSFKVIQGRWFWYQSKARMRLPISPSSWLWSYLALFLKYGDLLAKNWLFFLPLSHSAPSLPWFGILRWS